MARCSSYPLYYLLVPNYLNQEDTKVATDPFLDSVQPMIWRPNNLNDRRQVNIVTLPKYISSAVDCRLSI
jgi:hypothetical protein